MKIPGRIDISHYNYELPAERIARYPLDKRDDSKLLYYKRGKIDNHHFHEIPDLLSNNNHLIFNDTKVIQARLLFRKKTGSEIEIFLLEPHSPSDYLTAFQQTNECEWKCLVGNAKKWKSGILEKEVVTDDNPFMLRAEIAGIGEGHKLIRFSWDKPGVYFSQVLLLAGLTPLPPYLERKAESADKTRYQTVYSNYEGSVAAPTAGLHFTMNVLDKLRVKGVRITNLTLHVGAGTFIPVKGDDALLHPMHTEHFNVSLESLENMISHRQDMTAVGTTSLRTMESVYWLGIKLIQYPKDECNMLLDQWEAYHLRNDISREDAIFAIINHLKSQNLSQLNASTRIMIVPNYEFKMADSLITNFHQPNSTLLLLIAAFIGEDWKRVYDFAMQNNYRFLSYGDSSLLVGKNMA